MAQKLFLPFCEKFFLKTAACCQSNIHTYLGREKVFLTRGNRDETITYTLDTLYLLKFIRRKIRVARRKLGKKILQVSKKMGKGSLWGFYRKVY